jgi:hypothetical protein
MEFLGSDRVALDGVGCVCSAGMYGYEIAVGCSYRLLRDGDLGQRLVPGFINDLYTIYAQFLVAG